MSPVERGFPLFPLGIVALPSERLPLHIFEERYKAMIGRCLQDEAEFGIVWLADDGLRAVGCACQVTDVLERYPDGRFDIVTRGTRPFRIIERQDDLPWPAGTVEFLADRDEAPDPAVLEEARKVYADLVEEATDERPDANALAPLTAYDMAARIDFGSHAKQGLLDLRSENARLRLLTRLIRAALKRMELSEEANERARSNGRVRFR